MKSFDAEGKRWSKWDTCGDVSSNEVAECQEEFHGLVRVPELLSLSMKTFYENLLTTYNVPTMIMILCSGGGEPTSRE